MNITIIEKPGYEADDILGTLSIMGEKDGLDVTIGANEAKNVFRKDEVKKFEDVDILLQNAPTQDRHMFKIPKVLN